MSENPKDLHQVIALREQVLRTAMGTLSLQPWTVPMNEPVPEWLVPELLQSKALHVLSSDSGCCKTWLGLSLMLSGLFGFPVVGRTPNRHFSSIYLAADSTTWDIGQQLRKLVTAHKVTAKVPEDTHAFVMPIGFLFDDPAHVNVIADMARHWDIDALFIDVVLYAHRADENDNAEMARSVLRAAKWLRDNTDLAIYLVHHNSKHGGYRGAGTLTQAVEHHFTLTKHADRSISFFVQKLRGDEQEASNFRFILDRPEHGGRMLTLVESGPPPDSLQQQLLTLIEQAENQAMSRDAIASAMGETPTKSVDNALQSLRRAGRIAYDRPTWSLVGGDHDLSADGPIQP